jgi:hypothetical protein
MICQCAYTTKPRDPYSDMTLICTYNLEVNVYINDLDMCISCHLEWRTLVLKCNKNNYDCTYRIMSVCVSYTDDISCTACVCIYTYIQKCLGQGEIPV